MENIEIAEKIVQKLKLSEFSFQIKNIGYSFNSVVKYFRIPFNSREKLTFKESMLFVENLNSWINSDSFLSNYIEEVEYSGHMEYGYEYCLMCKNVT